MNDNVTALPDSISRYLADVERQLKTIDHPRKKEVVEDLRSHLEQRLSEIPSQEPTPAQIEEILAEMGPAEEYPEFLAPASGAEPRKCRRRPLAYIVLLAVIGFFAFLILLPSGSQTLGLHIREVFNCNFTANPFFSHKNFNKIQPGMTTGEVRELIGFPRFRYSVVGKEQEARWDYTTGAVAGAAFHREYQVLFDRATDLVLETRTFRLSHPDGVSSGNVRIMKQMKEKLGKITLTRSGDSERILLPSNDKLILIRLVSSVGCSDLTEQIEYHLQSIEKEFGCLQDKGIEVFYLVSGGYAPGEDAFLKEAYPALNQNLFVSSRPNIADRTSDSRTFAYKAGLLYALPPVYSGIEQEKVEYREDRQWLIRKLLADQPMK